MPRVFAVLLLGIVPGPLWAQDVRDRLPEKSSRYYAALLQGIKGGNLKEIQSAQEKLRPLAEHLDKRYGGALAPSIGKAGLTVEQASLWTYTALFQSLSLSYDEATDTLGNEDEVARRMRYALEEFAEVEPLMKARGDLGFQKGRDIRRSIQRSMFLLKDRQKFAENAQAIKASFAAVYPETAALTLRGALRSSAKEGRFRVVAGAHLKMVEDSVKASDPGKLRILESALGGEEKVLEAAVTALDAVFPSLRGLD